MFDAQRPYDLCTVPKSIAGRKWHIVLKNTIHETYHSHVKRTCGVHCITLLDTAAKNHTQDHRTNIAR